MVSSDLLAAYLNCPTKCWLMAAKEAAGHNTYAEWMLEQKESYRITQTHRLSEVMQEGASHSADIEDVDRLLQITGRLPPGSRFFGSHIAVAIAETSEGRRRAAGTSREQPKKSEEGGRTSSFSLNEVPVEEPEIMALASTLDGVECIRTKSSKGKAEFCPVRFQFLEKISHHDRILLGFDSLVLAKSLRRPIDFGRIIHGAAGIATRVDVKSIGTRVRKAIRAVDALLENCSPPELVLNDHCKECGFQTRCLRLAEQSEDLSLLANMGAKERARFRERGIFTITQLSYTFRPRRTRKAPGKPEKYQHSLKALAIREQKTHIVGSPKIVIEGTEVYFDVEGLPNEGFYYLIGMHVVKEGAVEIHSLWADTVADEQRIWEQFCKILMEVSRPTLVHYGSYEVTFLRRMQERYGSVADACPTIADTITNTVNIVSVIYAKVYFPTYSNGLKEIGRYLGANWTNSESSGLTSIVWRHQWEVSRSSDIRQQLIEYNSSDCAALIVLVRHLYLLLSGSTDVRNAVLTDRMPSGRGIFKLNTFHLPELEQINRAAYWDYQREKILVKSKGIKRPTSPKKLVRQRIDPPANKTVHVAAPLACIRCNKKKLYGHQTRRLVVIDIRFGSGSIKRWVTNYMSYYYRCPSCGAVFRSKESAGLGDRYGPCLRALCVYQIIDLRISQRRVAEFLKTVLSIELSRTQVNRFKQDAATLYQATYEALIRSIATGYLVHADETQVNIGGVIGYVWVFTNLDEVAYLYSPSREGELVRQVLRNFTGVLVTDFYSAYEGIDCPQQKCLIHLIRDLNEELYKESFNVEFKKLVADFTALLRPIIQTIDRYGLKARFLRKHKKQVSRFFQHLAACEFQSNAAIKCKQRLERHRENLFTFLNYDNVPWNNNNAEHAVKAFALLRRDFEGLSTEKGIKEYLILLSICETCRFKGLNFLDFLRSGVTDLRGYANRGKRRLSPIGT